ncbi:hypothetical protein PU629_15080 [Pullulanibacillus sp. KACC 23026]|nr:hypothetical protein [Pullulanibacillus sp. KACC 23026]WEG11471.1 hypothetical protein PU629_15080 [Pullulanibacillus sp. KACC 23026]
MALTDYFSRDQDCVNLTLDKLANSSNWEVREWVASACGVILERFF